MYICGSLTNLHLNVLYHISINPLFSNQLCSNTTKLLKQKQTYESRHQYHSLTVREISL